MNELLIKALMISVIGSAQVCVPAEVMNAPVKNSAVRQEVGAKYVGEEEDPGASQQDQTESVLQNDQTESYKKETEEVAVNEGNGQKSEEQILSDDGYPLVEKFNTDIPQGMFLNLKYKKHLPAYDYVLLSRSAANIRLEPTTKSRVIRTASYFEKVNLIESVKGQYISMYGSDVWYKLFWYENGKMKTGYMLSSLAQKRTFQFEKMKESMDKLKEKVDGNRMGYIYNYKNRLGRAPLYKGSSLDKYGNLRDQSAPGYYDINDRSEFIYIGDGELFSIIDESGSYYRIKLADYEKSLWVPKKYVYTKNAPSILSQVVVVDRKNQNEAVFEWTDLGWQMISYSFATTGANAKYKFETPLGYFMAIETKPKFIYLDDITREIAGYAPYAIRFTGGAYIHGVPIDYIKTDGQLIDPGHREALYTLGTVPRSHKCVRNFTSHAKFLYDWVKIGQASVIVIE